MNRWAPRPAAPTCSDAGFVMVEAVIAVALVALCVGTVVTAILAVEHQTVIGRATPALTLSAQNVLTDLRAATAYDAAQIAALDGRVTAFDTSEPGPSGSPQPLHVTASVSHSAATGRSVASVTVTNAQGESVTLQSTLAQEAPEPGAVLPSESPAPTAHTGAP